MGSNRHAYLIVAHNNFDLLEKLIQLLDDPRNDIYIHFDKKSVGADINKFSTKHSKLSVYQEIKVNWGGASQVRCELFLLQEAIKDYHQYYHLISGVDLPIKTQDEVHDFFNQNNGKEFIHFDSHRLTQSDISRVKYYHLLQEFKNSFNNNALKLTIKIINKILINLQKAIGINRIKKNLQIQKGSNWFSITHELAIYILSRKSWIEKFAKHTVSADELFLQTLVINSSFKHKLYVNKFNNDYHSCMRFIDWDRGRPYIFKLDDFSELITSDYLFARKFDPNTDSVIIDKIYNHIKEVQN